MHGVGAQDEHLISTPNRWTNWKSELGYPKIHKELCGGRSTKVGGSFGVGGILLQQFETFSNKVHPLSNGDGQVTNYAYDLGCTRATPKWCMWRSVNGHTTSWRKVVLVGDGQGQSRKGTYSIQGFCKQVLTWGEFEETSKMWLNIKKFRLPEGLNHKFLGPYVVPFKMLEIFFFNTYKLELLGNLKVHPIFHVSILKLVAHDASRPNR